MSGTPSKRNTGILSPTSTYASAAAIADTRRSRSDKSRTRAPRFSAPDPMTAKTKAEPKKHSLVQPCTEAVVPSTNLPPIERVEFTDDKGETERKETVRRARLDDEDGEGYDMQEYGDM